MNQFPAIVAGLCLGVASSAVSATGDYVVVVSDSSSADPGWAKVVDALATRHHATIVKWKKSPDEVLPALKKDLPRWTCFVATPAEAGREFVQTVHRLTRKLDNDPYTDTRWGILTGFDAANALEIASEAKPLSVNSVGAGTEVALDRCESGTWYCELKKGRMVTRPRGGEAGEKSVEPDTTKALVDLMNSGAPDLWVTSGHATERDWMIGFRYRNGFWKSKAGQLYGEDTKGGKFEIHSPNPKVFLPVGNCLMGHIDGPDAMALAYMRSAAVRQMAGYVLPTWYGYQGWGLLDYFVEQPGRFTLTEAFHANNVALVHRLVTCFPGSESVGAVDDMGRTTKGGSIRISDEAKSFGLTEQDAHGLLFDRDNVAFYGDPAWEARMAPGKLNWEQKLSVDSNGVHTLTITPLAGEDSWKPVNGNGSQRGGRPIIAWLPERIDPAKVRLEAGENLKPVIADDFILVPLPHLSNAPLTVQFATR